MALYLQDITYLRADTPPVHALRPQKAIPQVERALCLLTAQFVCQG